VTVEPQTVVEGAAARSGRRHLLRGHPAAAAAALTALSCLVAAGGLLNHHWPGDVIYYSQIGQRIAHGQIPYHDFYLEYPPGAIPVFALPSLISQYHYVLVFRLLMTLCGALAAAAGVAAVARSGAGERTVGRAAVALGLGPLALGPLFLNRYDVWPALLVSLGLLALLSDRTRWAFGLLGLAIVAKIYAIALLPVAAVHVYRRQGRRELVVSLGVLAAVGLVLTLPFAAVGFGGLGFSFYIQATRHLQVESLGAQILVALDHLGLYHARPFVGQPGSRDLAGLTADAVGVLSSVVEIAAVLLLGVAYARGPANARRLLLGAAAALVAFAALGKVLSPQYLVWLLPVVPLVEGMAGAWALGLLGVAVVGTQLLFYDSDGVASLTSVSWGVLARDIVLVALLGVLARALVRSEPR
jgi:Glycosyltransferase family 87